MSIDPEDKMENVLILIVVFLKSFMEFFLLFYEENKKGSHLRNF